MFALNQIIITNFRSFRGAHTFDFPETNGLYYLTGKNLVNPDLGANGAGKSTFLDAIAWCLYGRTARGLKANEILPWSGATSCTVALNLTVGDQQLVVKRSQKPNNLLLDDKPLDQEELEKHIRLNYQAFLRSVINAQFGESFFSLKPGDKLALFSDIMKLESWLERSERAAKETDTIDYDIMKAKQRISNREAQIEILQQDMDELRKQSKQFDANQVAKLNKLQDSLAEMASFQFTCRDELKALKAKLQKQGLLLTKKESDLQSAEKTRDEYVAVLSKVGNTISQLRERKAMAEESIVAVSGIKGACPHCGQEMTHLHRVTELKRLKARVAEYADLLEDSKQNHKVLMEEFIRVKSRVETYETARQEWQQQMRLTERDMDKLEDKLANHLIEEDKIKALIRVTEKEKNSFDAMFTEKHAKQTVLTNQSKADKEALADLEAKLEAVQWWVKGFKRIRLFIIEQAFQTLEIEVNNSLAQLGMPDWQITFDVERENKSGGVTKGFVVFIKSPANKDPVRWESWSGGETKRLELAGDLGLANLIMQQAGLRNTIEFYDEPSSHLSPEGMMDLANMLHERAVNEGKRIWIVDHAAVSNFGEFESIITARKDKNGTSIKLS